MTTTNTPKTEKIVMSGMRPTGRLHVGHYYGVLQNWIKLQEEHQCYFMVADWHALTTKYDDSKSITGNVREIILDWLAAGVDPEKAVIYVQSAIPEIAELHLLFSMLTPLPWVQGDPTLKDMVKMLHEDLNYGLLGYPILQTADVLTMRGNTVPVGKDQLAHLEISRDIARRFNHVYKTDLFPEPQPLLTETPLMLGLDGNKMGKSANNAIFLADTEDETWQKVRTGVTDPARVKKTDPGNPEECAAVFPLYQFFADQPAINLTAEECRTAARGCMNCKKLLAEYVNETLKPIRARRQLLAEDPTMLDTLLQAGIDKARQQATQTLALVKQVMFT